MRIFFPDSRGTSTKLWTSRISLKATICLNCTIAFVVTRWQPRSLNIPRRRQKIMQRKEVRNYTISILFLNTLSKRDYENCCYRTNHLSQIEKANINLNVNYHPLGHTTNFVLFWSFPASRYIHAWHFFESICKSLFDQSVLQHFRVKVRSDAIAGEISLKDHDFFFFLMLLSYLNWWILSMKKLKFIIYIHI